ncbi:MAG: hypothetical protein ACLR8X_14225 [Gallintestinimicrobium sp.]
MEECRLRDPPQVENPALQDSFFMCMSGGVFVLTLQQIRKAIFPAVSLPENPAKKVEKPLDTAIKSTYTRRACIGRGFYFDARKLL